MKSFDEMEFHPTSEKLADILCKKTHNTDPLFFRVMIAYYFGVVASMMRARIKTPDRKEIPINVYSINLSPSGTGKGHSTRVMEDEVINQFRQQFLTQTFPLLAEMELPKLANNRAISKNCDPDEELARTQKEFEGLGPLVFSFDSGTTAAVKQARHKLLMAKAGSMNLQIDEIGSNLLGNKEVLDPFLELYDMGHIKQKLIKNTAENLRNEEIVGKTPTNMMLFGTPSKLLDGSKVESEFYSMLDTGYARRCFFGYSRTHARMSHLTPQEILNQQMDVDVQNYLQGLSNQIGKLSDAALANKVIIVPDNVMLLFIEYQLMCEKRAASLPEHEEMKKAEISHRYFKSMKLAGAFAFIDGQPEVLEEHAYYAIKLAEASGKAFDQLLTRDRPYVKLAKYIADVNRNVTQADLVEDLPFYRGSLSQKQEMMQLAIAYGYQNNILIKKAFVDGIEFLRGESLKHTDLNKMKVSYSDDFAEGYVGEFAPFDQLHMLTQNVGLHWANHHFKDEYRKEDNAIPGFNMVVIDVDGSVNLSTAKLLLKDYKALFYTTKRHTDENQRFRIVMPINFELCLDAKDYKEFMGNLFEWLPFEVDSETGQRSRKWLSHNGHYEYQDGELLDVLPFIPKTSKNEMRKQHLSSQQSLDNLERWVINNTGDGNRNNQLLKYGYILLDAGFDFEGIRSRVMDLNSKLPDKLEEAEILGTIMVTVSRALGKR